MASPRRRQRRVRLVFGLLIPVLVAGEAVVVWPLIRPDPCAKLVETMCASGGDCGALRAAFAKAGGRVPTVREGQSGTRWH